jgi:redox-regulated HSP33 family molecular chaperone
MNWAFTSSDDVTETCAAGLLRGMLEIPSSSYQERAHLATIIDTVRAARLSDDDLLDMLENMSDEEAVRMFDDLGDRS